MFFYRHLQQNWRTVIDPLAIRVLVFNFSKWPPRKRYESQIKCLY